MNEFLSLIKSDLLSRRLLPLIALLGVGLVVAVGYVLTSGGSGGSTPAPQTSPSTASTGKKTVPVSVASVNPNLAASETPGGSRYQNRGSARNPFTPLPETAAEKAKEASTSSGGASSSTSSSPSSGSESKSGAGGGTGATEKPSTAPAPTKTSKPVKAEFPYSVTAELGLVPATPGQATTLTPYENLKPGQRLPSKSDARITFERVSASATSAVFKLDVPPILHGPGRCLPSPSECLAIALAVGRVEVLEYVEADGEVVAYELKVVKVDKRHEGASAARAAAKARTPHAAIKARDALTGPHAGIALASHIEHPAPANRR